jgi:hypothetical protein
VGVKNFIVDNNYLGFGEVSTLTNGYITSTISLPYSAYSKFTLAAKGLCQPYEDSTCSTKNIERLFVK